MPRSKNKLIPQGEAGLLIEESMRIIPGVDGKRYRLAKLLGTDPANIANWLTGKARVDPSFCQSVDYFSGGKIPAHKLRPDIFAAPGKNLPVHPNAHKGREYGAINRGGK